MSPRLLALLIVGFTAALTSTANGATPQWGKIGGIGIGMLQNAVYQQHGFGSSGRPGSYTRYRLQGGEVEIGFVHGRVAGVNCGALGGEAGCPQGFALPDGVTQHTHVPYKSPWKGYARYTPQQPQSDFYYWRKVVRAGGRPLHIYLITERGKVLSIAEATQ